MRLKKEFTEKPPLSIRCHGILKSAGMGQTAIRFWLVRVVPLLPALRRRNSPNRKTAFSLQRGRYHPGLVRLQPSDIRRHPAGNGPAKPAPPFTRNLPASTLRFSSAHTRFLREMSILPDLARIIPAPALHRDKPHPVFFQNTGCRKVSGRFFLFRAALRPAVPPEKRPMPTS